MAIQPVDNTQKINPGVMEGLKKNSFDEVTPKSAPEPSVRRGPEEENKGARIDTRA